MQLEIYKPTSGHPLPPVEWNFSEIKQWLSDGLDQYKGRVYDENQITQAKKDAAALRKLKEAIDGRRKEVKAFYSAPYDAFCAQAKELTSMIDVQVEEISAQVKAYESARKEEKQEKIKELYGTLIGNLAALVPYERLHNPKWLNVTTTMATITDELGRKIDKIMAGLASIDTLGLEADIAQQVKGVFLKDFDLAAALSEKDRIIRRREELERFKAEQDRRRVVDAGTPGAFDGLRPGDVVRFGGPGCVEAATDTRTPACSENAHAGRHSGNTGAEKMHTITFRICVTSAQLQGLGDYMKANGIRPERV